MRRDRKADRTVNAAEFLDDRRVFDVAHRGSAKFLGEENSEQAEFGELWTQFGREMLRFVPFHHVRFDLAFGKLADTLLDLFLFG